MKNLNEINRSFVVLAFLLSALHSIGQTTNAEKKIIVIDAGHGGIDCGAIGINGIKEKDIVLRLALVIRELNAMTKKTNMDIYLTRTTDTLISLKDRAKLTKTLNADLMISLHCNYSPNRDSRGLEIYVSERIGKNSKEATWIAMQIHTSLGANFGFVERGIRFEDFYILRETINHCPSILIELGFLSNLDEANYLNVDRNIKSLALVILKSLEF